MLEFRVTGDAVQKHQYEKPKRNCTVSPSFQAILRPAIYIKHIYEVGTGEHMYLASANDMTKANQLTGHPILYLCLHLHTQPQIPGPPERSGAFQQGPARDCICFIFT